MTTIHYNFDGNDYEYDVQPEEERAAIADFLFDTCFADKGIKRTPEIMKALEDVAEDERLEMDYEETYKVYCEDSAKEAYKDGLNFKKTLAMEGRDYARSKGI